MLTDEVTLKMRKTPIGADKTAGDRPVPFLQVKGVEMYGGFKGTETTRTPYLCKPDKARLVAEARLP